MAGRKTLIVIVGPTAVGKTALAVKVAERLQTEIISADSRQIYKELNIGVAKPSAEELRRVPHHLISSQSIFNTYDAGAYGRDALACINQLFITHETAVMVGGSGLYMRAALDGFDDLPEIDEVLRKNIRAEYELRGLTWLQHEVQHLDPEFFKIVDQQNPHRLLRALELLKTSGKPMKELRKQEKKQHPFRIVRVGLNLPREVLYHRIDERMDAMIAAGLFAEAKKFLPHQELNALQTVGYQEIFGYLNGHYDYDEAVRLLKRNSRHYAKRQLTWFTRDTDTRWFLSASEAEEWIAQEGVDGNH